MPHLKDHTVELTLIEKGSEGATAPPKESPKPKSVPINVGAQFESIGAGNVWEVTHCGYGGNVDVFCRAKSLHGMFKKKELRDESRFRRLN